METKAMTTGTWLNCRLGLNELLSRYGGMIEDCVEYANYTNNDSKKTYFIENAKYWSKKYKGVIVSINELNQY